MVFLWFSVFSLLDQASTTAKGLHRNGTYNYSDTVRREALSMWHHLYHVHCALHERPTILDPNSRDVFYQTVAIEATAQHLVGNHPTSCLFPDSILSLAILAGKKSLAGNNHLTEACEDASQMGWYCTGHKMFFFNIFQNGHSDTHLMRLKTLEKECGPLCNLEKPILGGKESFIGRVKAKVNL